MSCIVCGKWGCTEHVGDKGLRYEVRFKDSNGEEHTLGWTDDPAGGGFVEMIERHPAWHSPTVIDRGKPA